MVEFEEHRASNRPSVQERLLQPSDCPSDSEGDDDNSWEDWQVGQ